MYKVCDICRERREGKNVYPLLASALCTVAHFVHEIHLHLEDFQDKPQDNGEADKELLLWFLLEIFLWYSTHSKWKGVSMLLIGIEYHSQKARAHKDLY